jgi:hypothetical protein
MDKFVNEIEAERLARKTIEQYLNDCHCQSIDDAKKAVQKMLAVAKGAFDAIHYGQIEKIN